MTPQASHLPDDVYQTVNPANGKIIKTFLQTSDTDVLNALTKAQECYDKVWRRSSMAERRQIVGHAAEVLKTKAEEYAQLITLEMGKLIGEARFEVQVSIDILSYYATNAETFLRPQEIPAKNATIITEPIGIILAIEPWNFPYYQLARVAGPQIMAGNVVIVKPAPSTPQCALAFARLFEEAGAPTGVYTNIFSSIQQVNSLIEDFRVRGVTLTGSERAGTAVAERAGKNLKKVVLELGGSDPVVVLEDADLESTLNASVAGRLMCMGQACASSKRFIIVGKRRGDDFLRGLINRLAKLTVGEPTDDKTSIGPVASQRGLELLLSQVDGAVRNGARIVVGGKQIQRPGFYIEPTIITDISPDNPLFQQETFGPVFSVYITSSEAEGVELANATKFGLCASVFSSDSEHAQRVTKLLECGMVFVNRSPTTSAEIPWGGVKNSGYGKELGEVGIQEFVNKKVILT